MKPNENCPVCGKSDKKNEYSFLDMRKNLYHLSSCQTCKSKYITPAEKSIIEENEAYNEAYYGEKEEKFSMIYEKVIDYLRKNRAKRFSKVLNKSGRVLDIGCGNGKFLMHLQKYGNYEIYGTELDGKAALRASRLKDLHLHKKDLTEIVFPKNYFIGISMFHVFEHLENPVDYLKKIYIILKPGGTFVVSFPNISSWQSKIFKGYWLHLDPPRHRFFLKKNDFVALMKQFGFKLVKEQYVSIEQNPFGATQSLLNTICAKRDFLFESMKGNKKNRSGYEKLILLSHRIFFYISFPIFILSDILLAAPLKQSATVTYYFEKPSGAYSLEKENNYFS